MKNIMKMAMLALVLVASTASIQAQKFGFVNSQEILGEMPEVKQAEANLEALQQQLQKRLQASIEQLQADYLDIQQKIERGELSPRQQEVEAQTLQERQQKLAGEEQDMVNQIQSKREELLEPIYKRVNDAIAEVAKEKEYTFIFDQAVLLYYEEAMDVSTDVRTKLGF
jgi:outer membrane protein